MKVKKLAILTTHPIQYYAPVFRLLTERGNVAIKVFYSWGEKSLKKYDPGFRRVIEWDIPLMEGYEYEFLENISKDPGTHHFWGIVNPKLKLRIEEWKPDAVLVFGWNFYSHLQSLRYFHGRLQVLFRGDSTLLDERPGLRRIARRLVLTWVYRHVDIALYTGSANKRYYEANGLKTQQLVFAPHAIDNERFAGNPERNYEGRAAALRQKAGFDKEEIVVLFAGKLEEVKNPGLLLNVAQSYNRLNAQKIKVVFVGNGTLENSLKIQAAHDDNIRFIDFQNQSQMPVIYRIGDVFCLPSRSETWGLSVNEAMASGRPVITSDKVGCMEDLIRPGVTGFSFPSEKTEYLLEIFSLLDKEKLSVMGGYSQRKIQSWTIEIFCNAIETAVNG